MKLSEILSQGFKINRSSATACNRDGGDNVTIYGDCFGDPRVNLVVLVNGFACGIFNHDHRWIQCKLPPGQGADNTILVIVGGQISETEPLVGYGPCKAGTYALDPLKGEGYAIRLQKM